ncbi:hypothetical protein LZ30DRAFT_559695, partial [Colletotrichum cereale]
RNLSPTNKFGSACPTYLDNPFQPSGWHGDWAKYFILLLSRASEYDNRNHGDWLTASITFKILLDQTVPRLLEPVTVTPCLLHGSLTRSKLRINAGTGKALLLPSTTFYGHNEFDLGAWSSLNSTLSWNYFKEYQELIPPSNPEHGYYDRIKLYSI